MKAKIEDCYGCDGCVAVCPVGAITLQEDKAVIDLEKCKQCKSCELVCPLGLIVIEEK